MVDLQPASDSGVSDEDNLTNIATPAIEITAAEAGDAIRVYREGVLLGEATLVADRYQYEFASGQLAESDNTVTARSFDGVDESEDSPPLVIMLDTTGPRITASTPGEPVNLRTDTLDSAAVTFSEAIDFEPVGGSFTVEDVAITGPEGDVAPTAITSLGGGEYEVAFDPQTRRGAYAVSVGPDVVDLAGNLMDQDQDGVAGELSQDVFVLSFAAFDADTVFTTAMTITEGDTSYDGQDILVTGATVAIDGSHPFNSVHLINSAVLTHSANSSTQTRKLDLTVMEQVLVDSTSKIDVSGQGYLPGYTTGNTTEGGATHKSGGSYGGVGRAYWS
ncbi:MAG: Ig-like domain-containing protein, partial [Candidatus Nealsonbacteria bacterium]|nr:Ig-like domain-containing protein [Candidatus Nealsonbacteria bacterium]